MYQVIPRILYKLNQIPFIFLMTFPNLKENETVLTLFSLVARKIFFIDLWGNFKCFCTTGCAYLESTEPGAPLYVMAHPSEASSKFHLKKSLNLCLLSIHCISTWFECSGPGTDNNIRCQTSHDTLINT